MTQAQVDDLLEVCKALANPTRLQIMGWLRDPAVIDSLIDHLYTGGANDRHFSESVAAATFRVNC